ncbi:MAG: glycosyltransferase family 2 protein [Dethiobacteria bacterium]
MKSVTALVPAFNEAEKIALTLDALGKIPGIEEILVIDDGSADDTALIAARTGAVVFRLCRNRGKGEAVWWGARIAQHPLLALVDADLGSSAAEISRLMEPVVAGAADMAIAVFPPRSGKGGFGIVKALSRHGLFILSRKRFAEPLSGQRVLPVQLIRDMKRPPRGFGLEIALTLEALRCGYRVVEVPAPMYHRERGRDLLSFLHRGRQFMAVCHELWHGIWAKRVGEK